VGQEHALPLEKPGTFRAIARRLGDCESQQHLQPIGLKRLPFIANSDFHKPKHIYSWKTLIYAGKDSEAIKDCIRRNEHVAITLYRDFATAPVNHTRHDFTSFVEHAHYWQENLPLRVVNS